ncbi:MAG: TonB-dependent receptor, partial [Bacteroidales bacterium]|nr:TonB-dependent receptor [Bacteroidales bacterium]
DFRWRLAAGIYDQPPFYKEMRDPSGTINRNIKAQRSFHLLAGSDYYFMAWERPFKFTTELYYKYLWDLIPYKLENVRVRYSAQNIATGYATGIDLKLNGEFVKDAESWVSLSLMRTMEDIRNDFYFDNEGRKVEPGFYPRPTDQLVNFGLYFQDYVPQNPSYRVSLYFLYGSPLPFSPPVAGRYDLVYRMPAYKRVDIGFIKAIKEEGKMPAYTFLNKFRSIYLSAEIFNLFGTNNTISYLWVRTVSNLQNVPGMFAVPNYLTGRRFNLRLQMNF